MERIYDFLNVKRKLESVYMVGKSIESDVISANDIYSENIKMTNINIDNYDIDNLYADNVDVNVLNSKGVLNLFDTIFPQNTVDITSISSLGITNNKWFGGILAPNGKIYCVPFDSTSVLVINPKDNTFYNIGSLTGSRKWAGGVLASNGKIYCAPADSTSVLIIDPSNDTLDTTSITGLVGNLKWRGAVLAPNGKIYCVPYESINVLIIDPVNNSIDVTSMTGLNGGTKWIGGVLASNGKIYCVPYTNDSVLIIDPSNNAYDNTTINLSTTAIFKYSGGALGPDGKIYCAPSSRTNVLIIDPNNNTFNDIKIQGLTGNPTKWNGAVLSQNGKIYILPYDASTVPIIDVYSPIIPISFTETPTYNNTQRKLTCPGATFVTSISIGDNIILTLSTGDKLTGYVQTIESNTELIFITALGTISDTIISVEKTRIIDITTITGISSNDKYAGGILAPNGKIYGIPYSSTNSIIINPSLPTLNNWMINPYFNKF